MANTSNSTVGYEGSDFKINSSLVIALVVITISVLVIGVTVIVFFILRRQNESTDLKTRGFRPTDVHTHKKRDSAGEIFNIGEKEETFEESFSEGAVGHHQQLSSGRSMPVRSQTIYGTQPPSTSTIDLQADWMLEHAALVSLNPPLGLF
ncbi:10893_t:CDS:2 [Scutellospora calospora]|uniref:10893_t:CDS:1 n=1 Tax=Scutellospora calospora TaxID=85575 RepID=A0ACA9K299_9GLOM|nr:10893_t:CDS:2 [Scutellospora calospora]